MSRLKAPVGGCTVRMYRQGLGDCFLLAFGATQRSQKYVLIDCGVLLGTSNAEDTMRKVVTNIHQCTGGHLDALVVTHEHWDHVSGFMQAQREFGKIKVDKVWLSWAEDPNNPLARELRERRKAALQGVQMALSAAASAPPLFNQRIKSLSEFFGINLGATGRATTEEALDWVKAQWTTPHYCDTGKVPLTIDGLPEVKFYVLGPPASASYIRKSSPSKKTGDVYLDDAVSGQLGLYLAALGSAPMWRQTPQVKEKLKPFSSAYEFEPYGVDPLIKPLIDKYLSEPWRKIDADWTGAAGELALKLDAHTNNTSLVLAIELAPKDKVLLFPGDAQVGNWLSWDEVKWDGQAKDMTARDLLERTVLYKVGHHGSHNATLREKGLERMINQELVAFISVNRAIARDMKWRMPYEPLYSRLKEKTLGRVVLSDAGVPIACDDVAVESFRKLSAQTDLYCEYTILPWKPGNNNSK